MARYTFPARLFHSLLHAGFIPAHPPYMRVRIRRFSELSPRGPEVRGVGRHKGFAALQVSVSASPSSEPVKLSRGRLAGAVPPVSSTFYYSLSLFGPSSLP